MSFYSRKIEKMLPKAYIRRHVVHDIKSALVHFRELEPVLDQYVYNDGTTKTLVNLSGTIPVAYTGKTYNIPVCVWLEESYPRSAPLCYVKPTSEMLIMRSQNVSSNGEVLLPCLDQWRPGECDLVGLLQLMVSLFEDSPPVCMRPRPEPAQASCWLQFHRQSEVLSRSDGSLFLSLTADTDELLHQENETSC